MVGYIQKYNSTDIQFVVMVHTCININTQVNKMETTEIIMIITAYYRQLILMSKNTILQYAHSNTMLHVFTLLNFLMDFSIFKFWNCPFSNLGVSTWESEVAITWSHCTSIQARQVSELAAKSYHLVPAG